VLDATEYRADCHADEDCLFLNVHAPLQTPEGKG
jgi:carboxylesterase type B